MAKLINVAVGVLLKRHEDGWRVLIAKRPATGVLSGYWELPGGKIAPGESPADCLVREFDEELAITVRIGKALTVIEHEYPHGRVRLHAFFCEHQAGEAKDMEVAEHRWVRPNELANYRFPPANEPLTRQIIAALSDPAPHDLTQSPRPPN